MAILEAKQGKTLISYENCSMFAPLTNEFWDRKQVNFARESFFKYIYFEKEGERRLRLILLEELLDSDGKEKREFNEKGIGCKYILIV